MQFAGQAAPIVGVAMNSHQKQSGPARRQMNNISLASNFEARYWMQALGVTRGQLQEAVQAVGTQVELVMEYLNVPERRGMETRSIAQVEPRLPSQPNSGLST
jgi:hypothetical protein